MFTPLARDRPAAFSELLDETRQLDNDSFERSIGVSADGLGKVFISGWPQGGLNGNNAGGRDAFVTLNDAGGVLAWTRRI